MPENDDFKPPNPEPQLNPLIVTDTGTYERLTSQQRARNVYRTPEIREAICDMYIAGKSLHAISAIEGMPSYGSILRWMKECEDFRKAIEAARLLRATHFEEMALEAAHEPNDKDDVPAARLRYDANVWAAEVNNPQQYGKKTTVQGDASRPIVFQVSTGVPTKSDEKTIELNPDGTIKQDVQKLDTPTTDLTPIQTEPIEIPSA